MLKGIIIGIIATLVVEHVGLARVGAMADQGARYAADAAAQLKAQVGETTR